MNPQYRFHNPDNLTPEQVGEKYRLLLKTELVQRPDSMEIHCWDKHQAKWDTNGWRGYGSGQTYRVPLSTWPLPEEYACPPVKSPEVEDFSLNFLRIKPETTEGSMIKTPALAKYVEPLPEEHTWTLGNNGDVVAYRVLKWKKKPAQEPALTDNDAWESLLRTNANLGREVSELKKERKALSSQIQAAEARLAQLEWVPYSERRPTREDADDDECVIALDSSNMSFALWRFDAKPDRFFTHWRPFAPPAPPIDTDREEFKKFVQERGDGYMPRTEDQLFEIWKAARRAK